jgi:hypothetical protein
MRIFIRSSYTNFTSRHNFVTSLLPGLIWDLAVNNEHIFWARFDYAKIRRNMNLLQPAGNQSNNRTSQILCLNPHLRESLCRLEHGWLRFVSINTTPHRPLAFDRALPLGQDDWRFRQLLILEFPAIRLRSCSLRRNARRPVAARQPSRRRDTTNWLTSLSFITKSRSKSQNVELGITKCKGQIFWEALELTLLDSRSSGSGLGNRD